MVLSVFVQYLLHFSRFIVHVFAGCCSFTVNVKTKRWDAIRLAALCIIKSCHLAKADVVTKPVVVRRFLLPRRA